ncbi:hypothetical protein IEQ34_017428 [Dendrobium chrysotoxum]|uniref:Tocopherol cyclase n=1 Tax=Dendrobium chrysotoxum TaxID=161865 RepID=A0AAV7FTZ4_DENCH|nr:hypothetical protein IEQ34_017428 [Dendrobium chrysotoxum]
MDRSGSSALLRQPLTAVCPLPPRFLIFRKVPIANVEFRRRPPKPKAATSASEAEKTGAVSSSPVYIPTPRDRELRTPHSGYHFDGTARMFFEGWYFKVSIPHSRQSFCFMYSVENPAFSDGMGVLDRAMYGHRFTGVGAQILGADDKYICQFSEKSKNFWGSRQELMLGNTFIAGNNSAPPNGELTPQEFRKRVLEGFQNVKTARWEYSTRPVYGWGDIKSKQKSTAGWLAAFPVFEPHWQICMAGGLSTGWIEWDGERFEFENAPSYSEKNWGGGFPRKWFWVQCNVFKGASGEVALTAAGGLRKLAGLADNYENAALVGIHYGGNFYEFVPWNGTVSWEISQWGYWHISAENNQNMVELVATAEEPGTPLRAPTQEAGLVTACKDTCYGDLTLQLWEKTSDGKKGKLILDVTSNMAAVEVGGGPWFSTWKGTTSMPELVSSALQVPIDVDSFFPVPLFRPPGL